MPSDIPRPNPSPFSLPPASLPSPSTPHHPQNPSITHQLPPRVEPPPQLVPRQATGVNTAASNPTPSSPADRTAARVILAQNLNHNIVLSKLHRDQTQPLAIQPTSEPDYAIPSHLLPPPSKPPTGTPTPPSSFLLTLLAIGHSTTATPLPSPLRFELTDAAAHHNHQLLQSADYDLTRLHPLLGGTVSAPGSEFRPAALLQPLLGHHPNWEFVASLLTTGASVAFLEPLSDANRIAENAAILAYGNHKSAAKHATEIRSALLQDTIHGFSFPLPLHCLQHIPGAMLAPLGITAQHSIDSTGRRIPKFRMTHDQSFTSNPAARSFNQLADMSPFPEMIFGWCLSRLAHYILALRANHPSTPILLVKLDWKSAYRRICASPMLAAQCITQFDSLLHVAQRLTFGGAPNPAIWSAISELVTDLSNDMLLSDWEPSMLCSPYVSPDTLPHLLPSDMPFGAAVPLSVSPIPLSCGQFNCFIDDQIGAAIDTPRNRRRLATVAATAVHVVGRPVAPDEPIPRDPLPSLSKLAAEGTPSELLLCLGWEVNTRLLTICLPLDKYLSWTADLHQAYTSRRITASALESLVGRLNHAAQPIPNSSHFLNRLRSMTQPNCPPWHHYQIRSAVRHDLALWSHFLALSYHGVSLNNTVLRQPDQITLTDSCPMGLGGYSVSSGRAWCLAIPEALLRRTSNNLLEFLACAIGILLTLYDEVQFLPTLGAPLDFPFLSAAETTARDSPSTAQPPKLGPCILALCDNCSGVGWLHRSNFSNERDPGHEAIARHLGLACIHSNSLLAPLHIPGKSNLVADFLSRHCDYSHDSLTHYCHRFFAAQIPANFQVKPLPNEITSWALQMLHRSASSRRAAPNQPTAVMTLHGPDGALSCPPLAFPKIPSSTIATPKNANSLPPPSYNPSEVPTLHQTVQQLWSTALSQIPLAKWHRHSGITFGPAPSMTHSTPSDSFPL